MHKKEIYIFEYASTQGGSEGAQLGGQHDTQHRSKGAQQYTLHQADNDVHDHAKITNIVIMITMIMVVICSAIIDLIILLCCSSSFSKALVSSGSWSPLASTNLAGDDPIHKTGFNHYSGHCLRSSSIFTCGPGRTMASIR